MKNLTFLIIGLLIGLIGFISFRYINYKEVQDTHYHANFGLFINGKKIDFNQPKYIEELSSCVVEEELTPRKRVHFHNGQIDAVHVHDEAVTWENLTSNIGFSFGKSFLVDDKSNVYTNDDKNTIKFILNGKLVPPVLNSVIKSEDTLVISYGPETEEEIMKDQYPKVEKKANEYNQKADPASCSSGHKDDSFIDRLKHSIFN